MIAIPATKDNIAKLKNSKIYESACIVMDLDKLVTEIGCCSINKVCITNPQVISHMKKPICIGFVNYDIQLQIYTDMANCFKIDEPTYLLTNIKNVDFDTDSRPLGWGPALATLLLED